MKNHVKTLAILFLISLVAIGPVFAKKSPQVNGKKFKIAGQVFGKNDKGKIEPLLGVLIVNKNDSSKELTDVEGKFTCKAAPGDTLSLLFIGMIPFEFIVDSNNSSPINVVLEEAEVHIDY